MKINRSSQNFRLPAIVALTLIALCLGPAFGAEHRNSAKLRQNVDQKKEDKTKEQEKESGSLPKGDEKETAQPKLADKKATNPSVGRKGMIKEIVLPISGLTAKKIEPDDAITVRIDGSWPDAKGARYRLEYFGFEKGTFNLAEYLVAPEGIDRSKLPEIPVTIDSVVPPGIFLLDDVKPEKLPVIGYYWVLHYGALAAWAVGLILILVWGWKPKKKSTHSTEKQAPPTWASALKPLFVAAKEGNMTTGQQAELERLMISFWRDKLDLSGIPAKEAMEKLAKDEKAGPSVKTLEQWIHCPKERRTEEINDQDMDSLLAPYQELISAHPNEGIAS